MEWIIIDADATAHGCFIVRCGFISAMRMSTFFQSNKHMRSEYVPIAENNAVIVTWTFSDLD